MKKILTAILITIAALCGISPAYGASSYYRATVTVKTNTPGAGAVYASQTLTDNPDFSKGSNGESVSYEFTYETKFNYATTTTQTVYIYTQNLKPDTYRFDGFSAGSYEDKGSYYVAKLSIDCKKQAFITAPKYTYTASYSRMIKTATVTLAGNLDGVASAYASLNPNLDESRFKALSTSGNTFDLSYNISDNPGDSHSVYLFTRMDNNRYYLSSWKNGNTQLGNTQRIEIANVAFSNTDQPNQYNYTAYFEKNQFITAGYSTNDFNSDKPSISVSPEYNQAGDQVTLSAKAPVIYSENGVDYYNPNYSFEGWFDGDGNCASTDADWTFTVSGKANYTARFNFIANYHGKGFYRIKSYRQDYDEYLKAVGNFNLGGHELTDDKFMTGDLVFAGYKGSEEIPYSVSDPATVWYIGGNSEDVSDVKDHDSFKPIALTSNNLTAQGSVTSGKLFSSTGRATYMYYGSYPGSIAMRAARMGLAPCVARLDNEICYGGVSHNGDDNLYSSFQFEPLDEAHLKEFYFAATPDERTSFDGAYWTPMYTTFAYICTSYVKPYYITVTDDKCNYECKELTGSTDDQGRTIVPANCAVILRCLYSNPELCKLIPTTESGTAPADNYLKGVIQLNTQASSSNDDRVSAEYYHYSWNDNYKKSDYAQVSEMSYLFTIGEESADDENISLFADEEKVKCPVAFEKPVSTDVPLPSNSVYLDVQKVIDTYHPSDIPEVFTIAPNAVPTGIQGAGAEDAQAPVMWFDVQGRRVATPQPGGIYIRRQGTKAEKVTIM